MNRHILICFLAIMGFAISLNAQTEDSKWGLMLSGGKMEYNGDIGSNMVFGTPFQGHIGARVARYLSPSFDVVLAGSTGRHGVDFSTDSGNTNVDQFLSNVFQANLGVHYKILKGKKFTPFLSAGGGYISYSPENGVGGFANRGEEESGWHVPVGLGVKYQITDKFGLFYHSQYGFTGQDEYDGAYPNAPLNPIADGDGNDNYLLHELGLGFLFGKKDRDKDGVADDKDACPDTPGLKEYMGCPDTDGDTVIDKEDDCPEVAGLVKFRGCPDTDGDGVIDKNDACPDVAGEERYMGCPDTDGDGIADNKDKCPEESGVSKYDGCPIPDTDGDGFNDDDDECPTVAGTLRGCPDTDGDGFQDRNDNCPEVAGTVKGCPDRDNDGVADKDDKCPDEAGVPEMDGCPKVRKPSRSEIINRYCAPSIQFKSGTTTDETFDGIVRGIAEWSKSYPEAFFNVSGYSDSQGAPSANQALSKRRAKKVYEGLIRAGVPAERITYEGYGATNPIADNSTKEGREMNRRVQVCASTTKRIIETTNTKR